MHIEDQILFYLVNHNTIIAEICRHLKIYLNKKVFKSDRFIGVLCRVVAVFGGHYKNRIFLVRKIASSLAV